MKKNTHADDAHWQNYYQKLLARASRRTQNVAAAQMSHFGDLLAFEGREHELLALKGCGSKTAAELLGVLQQLLYRQTKTFRERERTQQTLPQHVESLQSSVAQAVLLLGNDARNLQFCHFMEKTANPVEAIIKKEVPVFNNDIPAESKLQWAEGFMAFAGMFKEHAEGQRLHSKSLQGRFVEALREIAAHCHANECAWTFNAYFDANKRLHLSDDFAALAAKLSTGSRNAAIRIFGKGEKCMLALLSFHGRENDLRNQKGIGRKAAEELQTLISGLHERFNYILQADNLPNLVSGPEACLYRLNRQVVRTVPFEAPDGLSLAAQYELALQQGAAFMQQYGTAEKTRFYGRVLEALLHDGATFKSVAHDLRVSDTRVVQILRAFSRDQYAHSNVFGGVMIKDTLLEQITQTIAATQYFPLSALQAALGDARSQIVYLLGAVFHFRLYQGDTAFVYTETESKLELDANLNYLVQSLQALILPAAEEEIIVRAHEIMQRQRSAQPFNPTFMRAMLKQLPQVHTTADGLYYIETAALGTAYQVYARILFEEKRWMSLKEITEHFHRYFPDKRGVVNMSEIKRKLGGRIINHAKKGLWRYCETPQQFDINATLTQILSESPLVHIDDVMERLQTMGYVYDVRTIRSYLLNSCYVSQDDNSLFVLQSARDNYPQYRWKRKYRGNTTNWAVKQTVEILRQHGGSMPYADFRQTILAQAEAEGFRNYVLYIVNRFVGEDKLFVREGDNLAVNEAVLAQTNLRSIGVYRKDPQYFDIQNKAIEILRQTEGHELRLTELMSRLAELPSFNATRVTLRHALGKQEDLPPQLHRILRDRQIVIRLEE